MRRMVRGLAVLALACGLMSAQDAFAFGGAATAAVAMAVVAGTAVVAGMAAAVGMAAAWYPGWGWGRLGLGYPYGGLWLGLPVL